MNHQTEPTPGPWALAIDDRPREEVLAGIGRSFAKTERVGPVWFVKTSDVNVAIVGDGPCAKANARLIVLSPQMRDALRGLVEACHFGSDYVMGACPFCLTDYPRDRTAHSEGCPVIVAEAVLASLEATQ